MRPRNYPLYLGLALVCLFAGLAIVGPALAPRDPLAANAFVRTGARVRMAPFAPFQVAGFPLGTDELGRDVLSRILWGIRPTLLICLAVAVARLVLGVVLGLAAGWFGGATARVVEGVSSIGWTLPSVVLAIAAIAYLGVGRGVATFVIALTVLGWVEVASLVQAQTQTIAHAPYIESARALGVRPLGVLRRHVLPQLRPLVPVLFAFELSAALLLVTELGFLGIYIGGGSTYEVSLATGGETHVLTSKYPELGQQISRFWTKFYRVPWEFLFVGLVIFGQIVAFNLVGEGLRRRLDVTRPRRVRWWQRLHLLEALDGGMRRVPRWAAISGALGALAIAAVLAVRLLPVFEDQPTSSSAGSTPPSAVTSNQPAAVDLEAVLTQPGVLPEGFRVQQVSKRVPDAFRKVPAPTEVRNISLRANNGNTANVVVLHYSDSEQRDQAIQTMLEAVIRGNLAVDEPIPSLPSPNASPIAGEQSFIVDTCSYDDPPDFQGCTVEPGSGVLLPVDVVFQRCNVAVQVRISTTTSAGQNKQVARFAKVVDEALSPVVCQPQAASNGQAAASAAPTFSTDPVAAERLAAIDLEALITQPQLLPSGFDVGQMSQRVPDRLRMVPKPLQVRSMTVTQAGLSAGNVTVLVYPTLEERDRAYSAVVNVMKQQDAAANTMGLVLPSDQPSVAGERSLTRGYFTDGAGGLLPDEVVFTRCAAVVWVHLGNETNAPPHQATITYAKALDAQLAPRVCRGQ